MHPAVTPTKRRELLEVAREFHRAVGRPILQPSVVGTDNLASQLIGGNIGNAARVRHALRRWFTFQQRVARKEATLIHVPDTENAVDFLGKFVSKEKYTRSVEYLTNARNAAAPLVANVTVALTRGLAYLA